MLTSSGQYPSAALPFILADRLFINAPPSSQSPSLCLSSSIIPQLFLSLLLPPICSLLCLSSRPHLLSLLPLQFILPSLCCITFHNHKAFSRFSYSESLRETYVPLFSASFNLYLPSGCFAALSSPHTCTFTNHSWEKLWCNHGPGVFVIRRRREIWSQDRNSNIINGKLKKSINTFLPDIFWDSHRQTPS